MVGGWIFTAAVAFSFGRMTNWLDAPVTPSSSAHAGNGAAGGGPGDSSSGAQGNSALGDRIGAFPADGGSGTTLAQIIGNKPLDVWLKKLMEEDDDIIRTRNFMKLVEVLNNPDDIKLALKTLGEGRNGGRGGRGGFGGFGGGRFSEYGMLMEKFTQIDPKAALTFAADQKGPEKFMATSTAMRSWARMDSAAALAWAQSEGANIQMDFGRGGPGGGAGGPGGTGADGQDGQPKENLALMTVLSQMAKTELDKAMSTASTAELGRMGDRMVGTLAEEMVSQRGVDGARKAVDSLPEGDFRDQYIQQLARQLSGKDAPGTAEWVNSLPSGDTKRRALGQAVREWAQDDPTAAGLFLTKQPASPDTDSARQVYAETVSRQTPSTGMTWASTITDQERRESTQVQIYTTWNRTDQPGAQQWLQSQTNMSDDLKNQMMSATQNRRGGAPGGGGGFPGGGGGNRFGNRGGNRQ